MGFFLIEKDEPPEPTKLCLACAADLVRRAVEAYESKKGHLPPVGIHVSIDLVGKTISMEEHTFTFGELGFTGC